MVTYCISPDCVALLIAPEEALSVRSAVRECLRAKGFRPWSDMEAELFSSPGGRLLIARPEAPLRERLTAPARRLRKRTALF